MGILRLTGNAVFFLVVFLFSHPLWAIEAPEQKEASHQVASVCVSCHRELGGTFAEPVALWETSIHHQMGNRCEGCHGGDPTDSAEAMSREKGFVGAPKNKADIPDFCGKCHVGVRENYVKSPHYQAALAGAGPTCVTCHNSHNVQKASMDLINEKTCTQCHSYDNAQRIKQAFVSAEVALKDHKEKIRYFEKRGMPAKRLEEKLFALRNSLHQMTHTLDTVEIQNKTHAVLKELEEMDGEMAAFRKKIHLRWMGGAGIGLFLAVLIAVLVLFLRTYEHENHV